MHVDLSSKDRQQISKSILEDTLIYSEKSKDPHSDGRDEPTLSADEIDDKELDKELAYDNYEYTKKRKLGVKVAKPIHRNGYHPDS